jgi:4-amino-4-deoxy-L-arabinose transferase-like glycosyltransferase
VKRSLLLVLAISTLLKLALLWPAADLPLRGDARQYVAGAVALAETGEASYPNPVWDEGHSSPVYPYGLAFLHRTFGAGGFLAAARLIQVLLSTLTAWFVYLVAARAFGHRNALISAAVTSLFPTFVGYTQFLYTETVYTFFFTGLAALLVTGPSPATRRRALLAGLVGGLAALTKGASIVQAPVVALWLLVIGRASTRRSLQTAGAFALGMILVIAPWSVRNTLRYDRFLLIDTNSGNVLYKNWNAIRQENHDIGMDKRWAADKLAYSGTIPFRERVDEENIAARSSAETAAALRFTLSHPLLFVRNSVIRAAELVNPTSFLVRSIRRGDQAWMPALFGEFLVWTVLLGTMAVLGFGVLGIAGRPPNAAALLPLLMVLANVAICVLIVSMSRYRFPMMPLTIPFAVDGFLRARGIWDERSYGFLLAVAAILFMVVAWVLYVPYSL